MSLVYNVYSNLVKLMSCRNLKLVSGDLTSVSGDEKSKTKLLEQDNLTATIQYNGYIMLEACDSDNKDRRFIKSFHPSVKTKPVKTIFILIDKHSFYVKAAQEFVKLLNKVPGIKEPEREYNMDILIISYDPPGSNITNKLSDYASLGSQDAGYIRFFTYDYS
jgi:hypothetical protein